jgi:hypothetical protein
MRLTTLAQRFLYILTPLPYSAPAQGLRRALCRQVRESRQKNSIALSRSPVPRQLAIYDRHANLRNAARGMGALKSAATLRSVTASSRAPPRPGRHSSTIASHGV